MVAQWNVFLNWYKHYYLKLWLEPYSNYECIILKGLKVSDSVETIFLLACLQSVFQVQLLEYDSRLTIPWLQQASDPPTSQKIFELNAISDWLTDPMCRIFHENGRLWTKAATVRLSEADRRYDFPSQTRGTARTESWFRARHWSQITTRLHEISHWIAIKTNLRYQWFCGRWMASKRRFFKPGHLQKWW